MSNLTPTPNEAEQSTLGGMMLSKAAVWDVFDVVTPPDFADWKHELVCRTIFELANTNRPTDVISVGDAMSANGELEKIGGASFLHGLTGIVPTAANAGYYAEIVKRAALQRRLQVAGAQIVDMTRDMTTGDAYDIAERARQVVDAAAATERFEVRPVGDTLPEVIESLRSQPRFVPSPWPSINELIGGFRPGALYVIGARPGAGKTIMGLQSAVQLAHEGNVAFCSLEMDTADLTKRMIAMQGSVSMESLTRSDISPKEWERIGNLRGQIARIPLFIDDRSGATMNQIRSFARSISRRGPLAAVVVDYLQLIPSSDTRKQRHEIVGEITRALKTMSRDLEVPVIALSQLNRESEGRGTTRRLPTLADLRESGSIEQDADVVMLLQRRVDDDDEFIAELDVVIAKNRHGRVGRVGLIWEGSYARVTSFPWE